MILTGAVMVVARVPVAPRGAQERVGGIGAGIRTLRADTVTIGVGDDGVRLAAVFATEGNRHRSGPGRERLAIDSDAGRVLGLEGVLEGPVGRLDISQGGRTGRDVAEDVD